MAERTEQVEPADEDHLVAFFAAVVPERLWRPVMARVAADGFAPLLPLGRFGAERRILGAVAELTDRVVCGRCGGSGIYGHHGVCYDCGGGRLLPR